jgi:hypothetical protein
MPVHLDALSFEALFHVPLQHRLVRVRSRSRGRQISGVFCAHEEYDTSGRLSARFEALGEAGFGERRRSGWRRTDGIGRLVDAGDLTGAKADRAGSSPLRHADPQRIDQRQAR